MHSDSIILAAKSAPEGKTLTAIKNSGIKAVELYLSQKLFSNLSNIIDICKGFAFRYAVHAPNDMYNPSLLAKFVKEISAEAVVFHDIYWEDEWEDIAKVFKTSGAKVCVENISTVYDAAKFMRRYGFGMCLDLEHLQMECAGVFKEEFIRAIKNASHIHLTGYKSGSRLWHTHLHHSPGHSLLLLGLIKKAGYRGFIVSEAKTSLQTHGEFRKLNRFFNDWLES